MIKVLPLRKAFMAGRIHNQDGILLAFGSCDKIKTVRNITMDKIQMRRL